MISIDAAEKVSAIKIVVVVVYALLVGYASLSPASGLAIGSWDKLAHFLTYGVFAALAFGVVNGTKAYLYACLAIVLYSGLMEVGQSYVPGRSMSAYDFLANTLGVAAGALFIKILAATSARP